MSHRTAATFAIAAALAGGALAAPAVATAAPQPTTATAAVRPDVRTTYVAATHTGTTARLQLVSRATGATLSTLASTPMLRQGSSLVNPYRDATIAPDGTVWAVQRGAAFYQSTLIKVSGGKAQPFMPYVVSARVSIDGSRVAMSVVSPDANRDGKGTKAIRVTSTAGKGTRTLAQTGFAVRRDGMPVGELAAYKINTWMGNHHLSVSYGCCGDSNTATISADTASSPARWAVNKGLGAVAKVSDNTVVVPVPTWSRPKSGASTLTGYDILWAGPGNPRGVKVTHVTATRLHPEPISTYIESSRTTPIEASFAPIMRYRPVATLDGMFIGR